jgi:hypothetical protein
MENEGIPVVVGQSHMMPGSDLTDVEGLDGDEPLSEGMNGRC